MLEKRLRRLVEQRLKSSLGSVRLEALLLLQDGLCAYDLRPIHVSLTNNGNKSRQATIDHVRPKSLEGGDNPRNLVASSHERNIQKGSSLPVGKWKPYFTHSSRDYRIARVMILELREIIARNILDDILAGRVPKEVVLSHFELGRLITRTYYDAFTNCPGLGGRGHAATILKRA